MKKLLFFANFLLSCFAVYGAQPVPNQSNFNEKDVQKCVNEDENLGIKISALVQDIEGQTEWNGYLVEYLKQNLFLLLTIDLPIFEHVLHKLFNLPMILTYDGQEDLNSDIIIKIYGQSGILDQILGLRSISMNRDWNNALFRIAQKVYQNSCHDTVSLHVYMRDYLLRWHACRNGFMLTGLQDAESRIFNTVTTGAGLDESVKKYLEDMICNPYMISVENKQRLLYNFVTLVMAGRYQNSNLMKTLYFIQRIVELGADIDCMMPDGLATFKETSKTDTRIVMAFRKAEENIRIAKKRYEEEKLAKTVAVFGIAAAQKFSNNVNQYIHPILGRILNCAKIAEPDVKSGLNHPSLQSIDLSEI